MEHPDAMYAPLAAGEREDALGPTPTSTHKDINAALHPDAYTPNVFAALENYGFCERGTAAQWAQGAARARQLDAGELPRRPEPSATWSGWQNTYDAGPSLRDEAQTRERQIPTANTIMVTVSGGTGTHTR